MSGVNRDARKLLADSGKYSVIDAGGADTKAVKGGSLRACDGCDADIALRLGAQLSMVGVVIKVEQAAYAVEIRIRDAATGKIIFARRGVYLGGATEWSSGVATLLKHELLSPHVNP